MPARKKEHLFSRIPSSGCFFIINVAYTKNSFLSDEIGWSTIGWPRDFYLQYKILYIYIYGYKYAYISNIRNILSSIDINALIGIKKRKLALQTIFLCFYLEGNAR